MSLVLLATLSGCASSLAMVRSTYKDTAILQIGAARSDVIEKFGRPDASANLKPRGYIDIYTIDSSAPSDASSVIAGVSDIILTGMTFGLWGLVKTPIELVEVAVKNQPRIFVLQYDGNEKLVQIESTREWRSSIISEADDKKCQLLASFDATGLSITEGSPLDGVAKPAVAIKSKRDQVYHQVLHQCLVRIYAESIK